MREPTIVLIHGAWAGSWIWDPIRPMLDASGIRVLTPDMPGSSAHPAEGDQLSLRSCVDHVLECCADVGGPLFLLGHSGGGVIATQAAEAISERVIGVIYVAGMMLPSGLGFAELTAGLRREIPEAAGITPFLEWSADRQTSRVPLNAAREIFLQDLPEEAAFAAAGKLGAQPEGTRAMIPHWTEERFGRLARLYVEARKDRSVILAAQRRMQQLVPGAHVASLDTGHVPQASAPRALADVIFSFIAQQCSRVDVQQDHTTPVSAGPQDYL
ncbi:alpha/beta fold hydrolase [Pseudomonas sp. OIL-1]|uniref:alpha/beta fold hydrolase n=1 Tax=Pseudomonas sp. OIL-1 TaxID=2706126 RepID=UPI0013A7A6C0|nr:alpha/beta hydrolase [Pseudomonas sp. OIL-1]QIB51331.1 alpha/beta hydrolase [Pseudomonas sp. OIL-1]